MFPLSFQGDFEASNGVGIRLRSTKEAAIAAQSFITRVLSHAMKFCRRVSYSYQNRRLSCRGSRLGAFEEIQEEA